MCAFPPISGHQKFSQPPNRRLPQNVSPNQPANAVGAPPPRVSEPTSLHLSPHVLPWARSGLDFSRDPLLGDTLSDYTLQSWKGVMDRYIIYIYIYHAYMDGKGIWEHIYIYIYNLHY